MHGDGVGQRGGPGVVELRRSGAVGRPPGTAQGEVLACDHGLDAVIVQQRSGIQQFLVHADAVDIGQRASEDPGPVAVRAEHGVLFGGGGLDLAGEAAIRWADLPFAGSWRRCRTVAPQSVQEEVPLTGRHCAQELQAFAPGQHAVGAARPVETADAVRIGPGGHGAT